MTAPVAAPKSASNFQELETYLRNDHGHGKIVQCLRKLLNVVCSDKGPEDTYRAYLERHHGSTLELVLKKKWRLPHEDLDSKTPENMDITLLYALFKILVEVKNDFRKTTKFMKKLTAVRKVGNDLLHLKISMKDLKLYDEVAPKMAELLDEAKKLYPSSITEIISIGKEIQHDIKCGFSPGGRDLAYNCYWVATKGRQIVNQRFQEYAKEDLLFDAGCVERLAVFHQLEVTSEEEEKNELTLEQLFVSLKERIAIVSGVVGAGKTTLLMYLMLQFSGPQSAIPNHLQCFEIVVFIQCRDRYNKNLKEVVEEHFGALCADMTAEDILLTLQQLRVLFLIDGFDELNEVSSAVLHELLDKTWHQGSRILITTCPQAVEDLKNLLRNKCKVSEEYKILQISELRKQLDFIEKYGLYLTKSSDAALAMRERFSSLNPKLQSLFTQPILLLYFCSIYKETPEKIDHWRSLNDLSMDRFELQKIVMKRKLSDKGVNDPDLLIDKILRVIGKWALEFLACNHVTFTCADILILKEPCSDKIKAHTSVVEVGTEVFLNIMLVVEKSPSGTRDTTYSFPHKSVQETVAANYVVRKMMLTEDTLQEILGVEPTKNAR
ncbi:NLR family CARD domain-containing protein 4-like [Hyalella azteca]|uniref:NLR family CARD domain-containing protein 4-like n=1 Tax=Hyalella azteca TaxID=294128 RepID=A0A8B7PJU4_HYAAZ|nr:NLR family CARD domain-containing protein 4-like [Hyalella azteca]